MSPVDEDIKNLIMAEFSKDKMLVDRFRKEQVRKEIHDTRLKEKQESQKTSTFDSSRAKKLEEKEKIDLEKEKLNLQNENLNTPVDRSNKRTGSKAKAIKKKFTPTKNKNLEK